MVNYILRLYVGNNADSSIIRQQVQLPTPENQLSLQNRAVLLFDGNHPQWINGHQKYLAIPILLAPAPDRFLKDVLAREIILPFQQHGVHEKTTRKI